MGQPQDLKAAFEIARTRYTGARVFLYIWTSLQVVFGTFIVLWLITAIIVKPERQAAKAIMLVGTAVSGAGIAWVTARRSAAKKEEEEAFKIFDDILRKAENIAPALPPHEELVEGWRGRANHEARQKIGVGTVLKKLKPPVHGYMAIESLDRGTSDDPNIWARP